MKIAVLKESAPGETRVAATPETVKKIVGLGHSVTVEAGAGARASFPDEQFKAAGAEISADGGIGAADLVVKVRRPSDAEIGKIKAGSGFVSLLEPYGDKATIDALAKAKIEALAMEFIPRISRAQSMDALSSQANLAGYRAVIEASALYGRAFPMMMTAAGTIAAAKVFIMGVGVAGLQAIATARRLGAVVSATDVRPATKEQVASLGGKFIAVEDEEFKQAETTAGYAKAMSGEYQAKQAALVTEHIAKQDIVITTALIPGRAAPVLVTEAQAKSMRPGSIIIDLAVAQGGNCPLSKPDELVEVGGVKIMGFTNLPARLASDASSLYAKNFLALLPLLADKESKAFAPAWDDEIIKGAMLSKGGALVHPHFAPKTAA
ncbi:Re/Si-specific NAD(P)(+) transhydrogenase subunit alpha [Candidatus Viadribacter manganicus]|uniref:NAD(P) transhydrogenase subunit alpha part 1 n=1 Tax=Candidatus Viadribacter manganicus TaxID=1759059 RepID=A0A1B1AFW6_9PROT|nr:Re/Si-specific NAD(P)(+) transhydrogenase subunit alpha [Candidatus Viadribacter manganicus]ANP45447.1 NAD(P) transhydrogenase subunit alpha [Candidatus Viadribacter manganicus]